MIGNMKQYALKLSKLTIIQHKFSAAETNQHGPCFIIALPNLIQFNLIQSNIREMMSNRTSYSSTTQKKDLVTRRNKSTTAPDTAGTGLFCADVL